jgi:hypothetical protein
MTQHSRIYYPSLPPPDLPRGRRRRLSARTRTQSKSDRIGSDRMMYLRITHEPLRRHAHDNNHHKQQAPAQQKA